MSDHLYILATIGFFALMLACIAACEKICTPTPMENLVVGIIALGLIAYLIFTIIRPEKF